MRKSRFSDEQIIAVLREADRSTVAEVAKKHKVSEQTIYGWRKHFNGLQPQDIKRPPLRHNSCRLDRTENRGR